jgi:PAS domain S-box-containing protein
LSYETLPVAHFDFDSRFHILDCNHEAELLFGYTASELQGKVVFEALFSSADRCAAEPQWRALAAANQRFDVACSNVTRSGETVWCRWKLGVRRGAGEGTSRVTAIADDLTSEHRAEAKLRASEERFRKLIEEAPIAIGMHRGGIGVYSNQAHCKLFGYRDPSELIGKPLLELVAPEERDAICERLRRRANGEQVEQSYEFIALRSGGSRIRVATHVLPLELPDGPTVITFHTDVTERRLAEELNRRIVETSAEGIWAVDENQRTVFVNPRMCQMLGYTEQEIREKPATEFMTASTLSDLHVHEARRRAGEAYIREATFRHKDGHEVVVSIAGTPLHDARGHFEGMFGMFTDITDRKQTEQALRESEERFRAVLEQASVGFILVDVNGLVLEWNNAVERMLGVAREAAVGHEIWDVQLQLLDPARRTPEQCATLRRLFSALVSTGKPSYPPRPERVKIWRADGSTRHVLQVLYTIRFGNGYRFAQVLWDITDAERAEEARRTAEARLQQAQKMEALGTLAGGVAHDFNNILAAIMGFTQVVYDDIPQHPELRDDLSQVLKACRRAKELVQQILAFSRRGTQERRPTDLGAIVKEAARLLRSTLPATLDVSCVISEGLPPVLADSTQIHQVLMNLCTNAAYSMQDTPGRLVIELFATMLSDEDAQKHTNLSAGTHLVLSVADTGHGMDAATVARIFEPFFTTKRAGEGTGLGLSVVHGIVAEHEGAVEVDSQVGVGSRFRVLLPTVKVDDLPRNAEFAVPHNGNGQPILVVDDEEALCKWLERMLARLGYCPYAMTDPRGALELIRASPSQFSLVITDLAMPKMSGVELIAQVRIVAPDLPIVLTTGYAAGLNADRMRELGVRGLIEKPASTSEVAELIGAILKTPTGASPL